MEFCEDGSVALSLKQQSGHDTQQQQDDVYCASVRPVNHALANHETVRARTRTLSVTPVPKAANPEHGAGGTDA